MHIGCYREQIVMVRRVTLSANISIRNRLANIIYNLSSVHRHIQYYNEFSVEIIVSGHELNMWQQITPSYI